MWPEPHWPASRRPMCDAPSGDAVWPPGWIRPLVPLRARFQTTTAATLGLATMAVALTLLFCWLLYTEALVATAAAIARAGFASQQAGGTRA